MKTIQEFTNMLIDQLRAGGHRETAKSYRSAIRSLLRFAQKTDLSFTELNPDLLHRYSQHLLVTLGRSRNCASLYLRLLSAICHKASREHLFELPADLFAGIFIGKGAPRRCAASIDALVRIIQLDLVKSHKHLAFSRDLFMLSFYLRGIPFVDLAHVRKIDVVKGVIHYYRQKTHQLVTVHIPALAQEIIDRYSPLTGDGIYLLPIIKRPGADDESLQYDSGLRLYDKHLNTIGDLLGFDEPLTSYVARHTWATVAHDHGVSIAYISQALGHSSEEVTRDYLQSFDDEALTEVNDYVIGWVQACVNGVETSKIRGKKEAFQPIKKRDKSEKKKEKSETKERILKFLRANVPVI